jgi:predicted NUDIX family phosphoesterase
MDEQVLVFRTGLLRSLGGLTGFSGDCDRLLPTLLAPENLHYLPRRIAEDDPEHLQLIPYMVLRAGDRVFCYQRGGKGGEGRLHDRWSLGVGGHISLEDGDRGQAAYQAGMARELAEEVDVQSEYSERIVGVIHDPSTPVGQVHFGVVHLFELAAPRVRALDPALAAGGFQSVDEIRGRKNVFESWSTLVIDHVLSS